MYQKSKDIRFITCNIPDKKKFIKIKDILFKKKLVSCINIVNKVTSFYIWKNKIKKNIEIRMMFKTFSFLKKKVIKIIKKIHPYKIPEISIFKVYKIDQDYFNWMKKTIITK